MKTINWHKLGLELLVVFLGVTGGFILNNWRDKQKNKQQEQNYIKGFIQDIDTSIEEIKGILDDDSIWFDNMSVKLRLMAKDSLALDSQVAIIHEILMVSNLSIETSTFEDIKFSGNLNLIRHFGLKESIVKYHNQIEGIFFVDTYYNQYFSDFVMPFVLNNFDMAKDSFFTYNDEIKGKLYNTTVGYYSMRQQRSDALQGTLESSNELRIQLKKYIN